MVLKVVVIINDVFIINVKMNCILFLFYKWINSFIFLSENDILICNVVIDGNIVFLFIVCLVLCLLII